MCIRDSISVLLNNPHIIYDFKDKEIVLPFCILDALDKIRLDSGEKGRAAKSICSILDESRKLGNLADGVCLPNGCKLRIETEFPEKSNIPFIINYRNYSNRILAVAWLISQNNKDVVLVSNDDNLRIKANTIGVSTIDFKGKRKVDENLYSGINEFEISKKLFKYFLQNNTFSFKYLVHAPSN